MKLTMPFRALVAGIAITGAAALSACASSPHRPVPEEGLPAEREPAAPPPPHWPVEAKPPTSMAASDLDLSTAVNAIGRRPQEDPRPAPRPTPQEVPPAEKPAAPATPHFEPLEHRWDITPPPYEINAKRSIWNPYEQNQLKGDYPIIGQDIFLALEASNFTLVERRNLPLPTGITGPAPGNEFFFGDGDNTVVSSTLALTIDLFKGQQAFKPVDWRLRLVPAVNVTQVHLEELGLVNINVDDDLDRTTWDAALEEAFAEVHLFNLNDRYDFISSEIGILKFRSDFRGHIFDERNLGVRLFGNADDNKWQYNLVGFNLLEKDTNSELNRFDGRNQEVIVANVYRFDWPIKGWNQELSFHYSHDDESVYFDRNDFLRRPTPIGLATPHEVETYYLGWASEGHFDRINVSTAVYQVWGNDDNNPLAARDVSISAQLAAIELSYDWDWFRLRGYLFYASGDPDTRDAKAEGFDGIVEAPNFAGGEFSYWQRQGIPLLGTFLNNRGSLFPNLKSLKFEGQSNFVNPGVLIFGIQGDAELTPTVRALAGLNWLRFMETDPLETFLELENIDRDIGVEVFLGVQYRPTLTNNIILNGGGAVLRPGSGLQKIYENDELLWHVFVELTLTW